MKKVGVFLTTYSGYGYFNKFILIFIAKGIL